ncbi:hypothetical protein LTR10_001934 [Elasticomyces elasticus]|nr:hypothetical protein LTR10_001934 [Elasticomyces elasticus]KAK4969148.1 hypothetical protein LTR42_009427 [Elasticomyces elasticus]
MDFFSRLVGGTYGPAKATPKAAVANDPHARLNRFKRAFDLVLDLCNKPRNPANETPLLEQLNAAVSRLALLVREESRASIPHLCLQYAAKSQIYTVIGRAALVSQYEPIVQSTVALFAALVDSEEEDFLASSPFAKSLMRLVTKVANSGNVLVGIDTETAILELLFTISAKIRLQPEILSVWFRSAAKPELDDVFVKKNNKNFVGITQKNDFPLCYLLIDRVHHEGRIGDFARTGLLYIFEATGRSVDLEEWIVASDLPTLMASGLGALYSQLSRELSILHPDATLPAVLAMSDYSTTHPRATAESAFSERHQAHMATFLSYLAFWQDVLDHCRSADVKQTLLDHFQILFLQQLLYPSLLQSSDTDAGSSVAVLTYMTCMVETLDYPDLIHMMLTYLLAIIDDSAKVPSTPATPIRPSMPPRSPTALKRRQSLMILTAPKDPEEAVEPGLFNLTDLMLNSIRSSGPQTVFAALKLTSTMVQRQRKYAFGTLLKVGSPKVPVLRRPSSDMLGQSLAVDTKHDTATTGIAAHPSRTVGSLDLELEEYKGIAAALHNGTFPEETYASFCDDVRFNIEAQLPFKSMIGDQDDLTDIGIYKLPLEDPLMRSLAELLRTFLSNSVDVNLELTQAFVSIVTCVELALDKWLALDSGEYAFDDAAAATPKPWHALLDQDETATWSALQGALRVPVWTANLAPILHTILQTLALEIDHVRITVPSLDRLLAGRQYMLQASTTPEQPFSGPPSLVRSTSPTSFLDVPGSNASRHGHSRSSSTSSSLARGRQSLSFDHTTRRAASPSPTPAFVRPGDTHAYSSSPAARSIFQPPPPETPSTTDVLMQKIVFPAIEEGDADGAQSRERTASLNHVLTNIVVLQQFVLELVAVLQVRSAVLGEKEVRYA